MENWLNSVYSDGSPQFVSSLSPELYETITIRIQIYEDAPVEHVFLRTLPDGAEHLEKAECIERRQGLAIYEAKLTMTEERMNYQFYLVCKDKIYYYTQNGITSYIPDHTYDFVIMTSYKQPEWVKEAVFYQIFPERFCNGRPEITVKDGEYEMFGNQTIQRKNFEDPVFHWQDGHAVDFHGGDLYGVKDKLPYLKELGVTAIYLNPIFLAPSTHKYDCADYYHVDPHFGGDEALAELCQAVHDMGMRIILDISINHTGTEHVWFKKALQDPASKERSYYFFEEGTIDEETGNTAYKGWFDNKSLPVLNYNSEALKDEIFRNSDSVLRKWLKEPYNIDGWRFDVADVFARNGKYQLQRPLWEQIRQAIREENPEAYILAEDWGDCGTYLQGKEWDSPMNYYGFGRIVRQFMGAGDLFLIRNEILRNVPYEMTAEDVEARMREHLAKLPFAIWQNQFNLIDSHDVSRIQHEGLDKESVRGASIWQFMMIGTPCIYYGDEAGIEGFTEEDAGFRYPMPWSKEESFKKDDVFKLYQTLADLRKQSKALTSGSMKVLYAKDRQLSIGRFDEKEAFVMVMNEGKGNKEIEVEVGVLGMSNDKEICEVTGRKTDICWVNNKTIKLCLAEHETLLLYQKKQHKFITKWKWEIKAL